MTPIQAVQSPLTCPASDEGFDAPSPSAAASAEARPSVRAGADALRPDELARSLSLSGGAEGVMAVVYARLGEQEERTRATRRQLQAREREMLREKVGAMKERAAAELVAGLAEAAGTLAAGVAPEGVWRGVTEGLCKATGGGARAVGTLAEAEAAAAGDLAGAYGELATDESARLERVGRLADRALAHVDAVAQARHEARMAAIRG